MPDETHTADAERDGDANTASPDAEGTRAVAAQKAPLWRRLLFGAFVTLAVLFFAATMLYEFGSMWVADRDMRDAYDVLVVQGQAQPIEVRFHIPIPGCQCHSDDPVLTMQHSNRRISECMGCHGG